VLAARSRGDSKAESRDKFSRKTKREEKEVIYSSGDFEKKEEPRG